MLRFSVPFELENDHGFVDLVVEKAATAFSAPYFGFEVMHAGVILDASQASLAGAQANVFGMDRRLV